MQQIRAMREKHFRLYSLLAALGWAAVCAVSIYMLFDLLQYMHHTTPCMRMGTCTVK